MKKHREHAGFFCLKFVQDSETEADQGRLLKLLVPFQQCRSQPAVLDVRGVSELPWGAPFLRIASLVWPDCMLGAGCRPGHTSIKPLECRAKDGRLLAHAPGWLGSHLLPVQV